MASWTIRYPILMSAIFKMEQLQMTLWSLATQSKYAGTYCYFLKRDFPLGCWPIHASQKDSYLSFHVFRLYVFEHGFVATTFHLHTNLPSVYIHDLVSVVMVWAIPFPFLGTFLEAWKLSTSELLQLSPKLWPIRVPLRPRCDLISSHCSATQGRITKPSKTSPLHCEAFLVSSVHTINPSLLEDTYQN